LRAALNSLAVAAPDWLRVHAQPEWVERYDRHNDDPWHPTKKGDREAQAATIGTDGAALLAAVYAADAPGWLREVPAVELLRQVWVQNYVPAGDGLRWRTATDGLPPAAQYISAPHELDAHYAGQQIAWIGSKAHCTEACEPTAPHLITHVETTTAPVPDGPPCPTRRRRRRCTMPCWSGRCSRGNTWWTPVTWMRP
jgi:transposase